MGQNVLGTGFCWSRIWSARPRNIQLEPSSISVFVNRPVNPNCQSKLKFDPSIQIEIWLSSSQYTLCFFPSYWSFPPCNLNFRHTPPPFLSVGFFGVFWSPAHWATYPIPLAFCFFQGDCMSPGNWGEIDWGEVGGWMRRSELCVREKPVCHFLRLHSLSFIKISC